MRFKKVLLVLLIITLPGCDFFRGGPSENPNTGVGKEIGDISAPLGSGAALSSALASANLDAIEKASCPYCNWSGKASSAAKSTSVGKDLTADAIGEGDAAFGCFLVQLSRMFESAPASDFLAAFGEPAIHVQADILDKTNSNALCTKLSSMHPKKYYQMFPNLPFNNYQFSHSNPKKFFQEMLKRAKNNGISLSRLQDDLFALDNQLGQLLELLSISRANASFSFTIPKDLCQVSRDIVVNRIDLEGFNGILGSLKVFVNLLHSYAIGLDPARFVGGNPAVANDTVNEREFVADANGVGGDGKKIAELISGRGDISSLSPLFLNSLNSLIAVLDGVHSEQDSQVFGYLFSMGRFQKFFRNVNRASKDLKSSLEHPGVLSPFTQLGHPSIKVDAGNFMSHLPDPKGVSSSDPFVPSRYGGIRGVANFWEVLLNGIVNF